MKNQDTHGLDQARAQAASIAAMVAALTCNYDRLKELRDERETLASAAEDPESDDETAQAAAALAQWDEDNGDELQDLKDAAGDCKDEDEARERIQEDALSVEVRGGWSNPCNQSELLDVEEFRILLCTGGPAVQIRGELRHSQPARAWIEYQDWGTPWTQFFDINQSTLLEYCNQFYFGE